MSHSSLGQKIRSMLPGRHRTSQLSPPSYSQFSADKPVPSETLQQHPDYSPEVAAIQANDNPQWLWTNAECRAWITAVMIKFLNVNRAEAEGVAARFTGFGPNLFLMTVKNWSWILGATVPSSMGLGIYSLIISKRTEKGAVPKGVNIPNAKPN